MVRKDINMLLEKFQPKEKYDGHNIREIIIKYASEYQNFKSNFNNIEKVEIGDIFLFNIAKQNHPCVVISIKNEICYGIVLSTKDHEKHFLKKIEQSRLYKSSCFTTTIVSFTTQEVLDNFVNIFDSKEELKEVKKLILQKYKEIL